jgi:hypothetical protein
VAVCAVLFLIEQFYAAVSKRSADRNCVLCCRQQAICRPEFRFMLPSASDLPTGIPFFMSLN